MDYAEAAYFESDHCQHVADWQEVKRLARKRARVLEGIAQYQRRIGRGRYA